MRRQKPAFDLLVGSALFAAVAHGYPVDMDKLPNQGRNSLGCLVCHLSPAGEEINAFGRDYRDNDHRYDERLKRLDSDRDGFPNEAELLATPPSNPGDPASYPWDPPLAWAYLATCSAVILWTAGAFAVVLRKRHPRP